MNTKWLIPDLSPTEQHSVAKSKSIEKDRWDNNYHENSYYDVWSITEDHEVLSLFTKQIEGSNLFVLIPGCGSKTHLQRTICKEFAGLLTLVVCSDWSQSAISLASKEFSSPAVKYVIADTSDLSFDSDSFDYVVISNSILSESDCLNRQMLSECNRVLKSGGKLIGLFPSIFATYEMCHLEPSCSQWLTDGTIDIEKNRFFEKTQNLPQIFYSPIRLRRIFIESRFNINSISLYFFDSEHALRETARIYGVSPDSGLAIWEFFIVAEKPRKIA